MSLTLLHPGLLALLVDTGRPRSRSLGVPVGGAADRAALALGNALVGNPPDSSGVEITLAGPTLEAQQSTACVVFGAPFPVAIHGRPVTIGTTFTLGPGDVLHIGRTPSGARGYLCVAGGFDAPAILGSRSGLEPLKAGDVLACRPSRCESRGLPFASFGEWQTKDSPLCWTAASGPPRRAAPTDSGVGAAHRGGPAFTDGGMASIY